MGAVWCKKKGKCKRLGVGHPQVYAYKHVSLEKDGERKLLLIHRLVAMTFLDKKKFKYHETENPDDINLDDLIVNHKDENKHNNCVDNLEWCTNKYNISYSSKRHKGKSVIQYDLNYEYIRLWNSVFEACEELNLVKKYIYDCCEHKRKTYAGFIWNYEDDKTVL